MKDIIMFAKKFKISDMYRTKKKGLKELLKTKRFRHEIISCRV